MIENLAMPPESAFVELPGMRGLRIARVGQADGKTLEIVEAVAGVVIPMQHHDGDERGRVLAGALQFVENGVARKLTAGDSWHVEAGTDQGPHMVLEDGTKVAVLRSASAAH